ncbi:hypothetical protein [Flavobacterium sp.]|uniref:hypothetical protein n=1 Tax=Flavobacterium sp. TaxID=239 RepID=UPI00286E8FD4|nr:hypothetical protein [Flavobacterium sp.]
MVNYKEELYPKNLNVLLSYADEIAEKIIVNLNSKNAKRVVELYSEINGKIIRNKKQFEELGYTPNESNEFKGLYIFGEEQSGKVIPVYVGISRTVFRRLRQHTFGKNHNQCSLAYLKTKQKKIEITRKTVTSEDMLPAKTIIQNYKVVLVPVTNDYDLYFLEVVLAGKFKTKWNSFKTH